MPFFFNKTLRPIFYASERELLKFANQVRVAGEGEIIGRFQEATRRNPHTCLIAQALNFDSEITPLSKPSQSLASAYGSRNSKGQYKWTLSTTPSYISEAIAKKLGLERHSTGVAILPRRIGNAAHAFDAGRGWTKKYATNEAI